MFNVEDFKLIPKIKCYLHLNIEKVDNAQLPLVGTTCDVWKGSLGKQHVAVKVLRLHAIKNVTGKDLGNHIIREVDVWAALRHKNVLPFLGICLWENAKSLSFVSPWMVATSTKFLQKNKHTVNFSHFIFEIADGLAYLHSKDFVHCDIRGGNILVSDSGTPYIADFGLSKRLIGDCNNGGSDSIGTTRWMARELLDPSISSPKYTKNSDMWAFGMTVYELFTEKLPYDNCNEPGAILDIIDGKVPQITESALANWETLIVPINTLCQSCWDSDVELRPTAKEVLKLLKNIQRALASPISGYRTTLRLFESGTGTTVPSQSSSVDILNSVSSPSNLLETATERSDNSFNSAATVTKLSSSSITADFLAINMISPISELNEYLQQKSKRESLKWVNLSSGPDHFPLWTSICTVGGQEYGRADGHQIKNAQEDAALKALRILRLQDPQDITPAPLTARKSIVHQFKNYLNLQNLRNDVEWRYASTGCAHIPKWDCWLTLRVNGRVSSVTGTGPTKKEAESKAVEALMKNLGLEF